MPKFEIVVSYEMYGKYVIDADTLQEAENKVFESEVCLPTDTVYVEDSFKLDKEAMTYGQIITDKEADYKV